MKAEQIIKNEITSQLVKKGSHLVGVEVECIIFDMTHKRLPVDRPGVYNSLALVKDLVDSGLPGRAKDIYSLEPGGQLEWASQPTPSLKTVQTQFDDHSKRLGALLRRKKLFAIDLSLDPLYHPEEVDLISQNKYKQMDSMFADTGELGRWMMRNSTSTQINIDYSSTEEAEEMAFLADCVQPIASILFSNTPYIHGKKTGNENSRYKVWRNTDPLRCGSLFSHGIDRKEGLLDRFCEVVLNAPLIFTKDDEEKTGSFPGNAKEWINSRPEGTSDSMLAKTALHQIFTHVRFKHVIEIRGCDRPPFGYELAPAAFWSGLLIDPETRKEAVSIVENWTKQERTELENTALSIDTDTPGPGGLAISDWINKFAFLAKKGLLHSSKRTGNDENVFLEPFLEKYSKYGQAGKFFQERFDTVEDLFECYKNMSPGKDCEW